MGVWVEGWEWEWEWEVEGWGWGWEDDEWVVEWGWVDDDVAERRGEQRLALCCTHGPDDIACMGLLFEIYSSNDRDNTAAVIKTCTAKLEDV
jgi:hypothetical protein